ncbi:hypothetical protein CHS0354_032280 [Potamilus streckersoni]|uniref:AGRL2-4 GAIN subdomain A domain-containing protein n=1 Tax=Potamilus streckersoni TaxID=2493646 RepID=A0AAE0RPP4_9BIVA|nr:hypothetical protein CHS0354_032280 [Potamilus streckersoni]
MNKSRAQILSASCSNDVHAANDVSYCMIDKLMDGFGVTNVSTVLADLQDATNPSARALMGAELNFVVSILDKLVNIKSSTGANVSEYTNFLKIASNTIDVGTKDSWAELITKEKQGAESVMNTIENFVFSDLNTSRPSNASHTIHTDNIGIAVKL